GLRGGASAPGEVGGREAHLHPRVTSARGRGRGGAARSRSLRLRSWGGNRNDVLTRDPAVSQSGAPACDGRCPGPPGSASRSRDMPKLLLTLLRFVPALAAARPADLLAVRLTPVAGAPGVLDAQVRLTAGTLRQLVPGLPADLSDAALSEAALA